MTNDEARMTKEGPKLECQLGHRTSYIFIKFRISSLFHHSSFVIRHFFSCVFLASCAAHGGTLTPTISGPIGDPEKAGLELAQKLVAMAPQENSSASGVLKIRDKEGNTREVPVKCEVSLSPSRTGSPEARSNTWQVTYVAGRTAISASGNQQPEEKLTILHSPNQPNEYLYFRGTAQPQKLTGAQAMIPFAGSDFWLADLGLEFLHWPKQRLLKTEMRRSRWCRVLQSDNPSRSPTGYARIISWIDKESGGPIVAEGYDRAGKKIKEFSIRSLKRVEGVWQLEEMQISSEEPKSRTRLEFDLDKPHQNSTK